MNLFLECYSGIFVTYVELTRVKEKDCVSCYCDIHACFFLSIVFVNINIYICLCLNWASIILILRPDQGPIHSSYTHTDIHVGIFHFYEKKVFWPTFLFSQMHFFVDPMVSALESFHCKNRVASRISAGQAI